MPRLAPNNAATDVLVVPQAAQVLRALSPVRREYDEGGTRLHECANRILGVVERFGLRPVISPETPAPITPDDQGAVCFQVVLPADG